MPVRMQVGLPADFYDATFVMEIVR